MPELPEVETSRRGIAPYLRKQSITKVIVRQHRLRWPVPEQLESILTGQTIQQVSRRAKYLLLQCNNGTLIIHLGMSGHLRVLDSIEEANKHDHIDIELKNGHVLRYSDPRRFGAFLWTQNDVKQHPLLACLGPEPLDSDFDADYLYQQAKGRKTAIKNLIMNGQVVAGVGNIYANEVLYLAGIHPAKAAGRIKKTDIIKLVNAIKLVLKKALQAGGTTLKDFRQSDGKPGYFAQKLNVYNRAGESCSQCGCAIKIIRQTQRASYFCPRCQRK